jgi:hypothetical protein
MKGLKDVLREEVEKAEIDYSPYFLKENPFPINPVASPSSPFCEEVRKEERDRIVHDSIIPAFRNHEGVHYWVHGQWGVGKSAFMHFLANHINEVFKEKNLAVAIYVDSIGKGIVDVTRKVIASLGMKFFQKTRDLVLGRVALENIDDLTVVKGLEAFVPGLDATTRKKMILDQLNENPSNVMTLLKVGVIDQKKLLACVKTKMIESHCSAGFVGLFLGSLGDMEQIYPELFQKLKTAQDLVSVFKVIELAGFKMSYLLVDQFENQITGFKGDSQGKFIDELCDLTDQCKTCLTLIMTMTPELASSVVRSVSFQRLLDHPRMPLTRQVILNPLTLSNTITLIGFYLNAYRLKKTLEISDLHPFTQEAIRIVFKRGKGLPGRILLECRELLTKGARKGYVTIDEDFAR